LLTGRVGEKAEKAEGEVGEEEKDEFEDEHEHEKDEKPEDERRRADEDAPESDDVGAIGKFAAGEEGGKKRRGVENGGNENEGTKE